jgi:hypothetical protein
MAAPQPPKPVKYFVALLWRDAAVLPLALTELERHWGPLDFQGAAHPFEGTNYYDAEMGPGLQRRIVTFAALRSPEDLASAKLRCNEIEDRLAGPSGRRVNLDVGYADHNKIVLASAKGLGQKIYLSHGIYADLVARYSHGRYQPFEWTFPDFKGGRYDAELTEIRERYLNQLRERS